MIAPVIHCLNYQQIKTNLEICKRNGIEMVFLINHHSSDVAILQLKDWFIMAKSEFPDIKIGLNFLQLNTEDSIKLCESIEADAIWTDYQGNIAHNIPLFGPVAFKYQKHVPDDMLESVCKEAIKNFEVITTSGPATGKPASIEKIKNIRSYIGDHKLAIASGVNKLNKKLFEPYVDYMLVASSITDYNEIIIEGELKDLINS